MLQYGAMKVISAPLVVKYPVVVKAAPEADGGLLYKLPAPLKELLKQKGEYIHGFRDYEFSKRTLDRSKLTERGLRDVIAAIRSSELRFKGLVCFASR